MHVIYELLMIPASSKAEIEIIDNLCVAAEIGKAHIIHIISYPTFEILLIIIMEAAEAEAMDILRLANVSLNENFTRMKKRNEK
jgi:hypothetical protein